MSGGGPTAVSTLWRNNYAAIMHEIETPWREHDPDGECCRAAVAAATDPSAGSEQA